VREGSSCRQARESCLRTFKLLVQYDGTDYVGWQRQAAGASIQGLIEEALALIEGRAVTVQGAGRTDAGVHAAGQVASVRLETALDEATLGRAINANLPLAIRVMHVAVMGDDFHARFSANAKRYEYRIWNGPVCPPFVRLYVWHVPQALDVEAMRRATTSIVGRHDFAAFQGAGSSTHSTIRTITTAEWRGGGSTGPLVLSISGDGFLRHMVRGIAGTLVEVGRGWRAPDALTALLSTGQRQQVGRTAPACGLFLMEVDYGDER